MSRKLIPFMILINLLLLLMGLIYEGNGGLRYGIDDQGNILYSNDLQSSGGDDSAILSLGMLAFVIPTAMGIIILLKRSNSFIFNLLQVAIIGVFTFILFLVNLDTSLLTSIILGDSLLLTSLLGTLFLLILSSLQLVPVLKAKIEERIRFKKWLVNEN